MAQAAPEPDVLRLYRVHVALDVTPIWWADDWALDAPEIHAVIQKPSLGIVKRLVEIRISAEGVVLTLGVLSSATLAGLEHERLRIWQELNEKAKGHQPRLVLLAQARNALRDQPSVLHTGVLLRPVVIPPNAPRGLALFLSGAAAAVVKSHGTIWTPPAAVP
jgi:hypothetical protein